MSLANCNAVVGRIHWGIWTALGLVGLYSALGFWAAPAALRYTLTHTLAEQWQRPVEVGEITFNPYDMELKIANFSIANAAKTQELANTSTSSTAIESTAQTEFAETAGSHAIASETLSPQTRATDAVDAAEQQEVVALDDVALPDAGDLLRFELLHINVHVASVFKRQIGFETIRLENPYVRAELDEQGELELLRVFTAQAPAADPAASVVDPMPAVPTATVSDSAAQTQKAEEPAQSADRDSSPATTNKVVEIPQSAETNSPAAIDASQQAAAAGTSNTAPPHDTAEARTEQAQALPPIWLAQLAIVQGEIDFIDRSRGDFAQKLLLKGIEIEDFHTARDDRSNRIALQLNDGQTGEISFRTDHFRLQPFALKGQLQIGQLALAPIWQWLNLPLNFALTAPVLDLQTDIDIAQAEELVVTTHNGQLKLTGTKLAPKSQAGAHLIGLEVLAVNGIEFDLRQQLLSVAEVNASGAELELVLDKKGNLNILPMFTTEPVKPEKQPAEETAATAPWRVVIQSTKLTDSSVSFTDESPRRPFKTRISPLDIHLAEFEPLNGSKPFTVVAELGLGAEKLAQSGKLNAAADITLTPFSMTAKLNAADLPLQLVQPYVADAMRARLTRGELSAELALTMDKALQVKGDASVNDLQLHHQNGRASLLSLDKLQVSSLNYNAAKNSVAIQKIALNKLATSFRINEDGSTNIQDIVIEQPASNKPAGKPLQLAINTIAINKADLGFADHTLSQNFQVAIKDLSGAINNIKSNTAQLATVDLAGKVDHYAPATIKGSFNVFGAQPILDMGVKLDNVELTSFTPYSGTYAGFKIERGQLDIDLNYQLADNKIAGKNRIVMDQFTLGEQVESPKAVDLPLRLALALLRDEKGVIDLGFEVNGDLDDPSFSVGGILWKVLTNIVKKAVASPMKALGALGSFGGGAEGNAIEFTAGSAALSDLAKTQAAELKTALDKRSEFRLNLQGNVLPEIDRLALQRRQLAAQLAPGDNEKQLALLASDAGQSRGLRRQLMKLYERKLNKSYEEMEATLAEQFPNADTDELHARTYSAVFDEIAVSLAVDQSDLRQLAMDRALALRAYMTEELGFAANRVMVVDYNTDPAAAASNCLIQLAM